MFVARILYPVKVLGPGNRVGIWFSGCSHRCNGCSNPELWEKDDKYIITPIDLMNIIRKLEETNTIDGFTLTGGDPIEQGDELLLFLKMIESITDDIILYTGYDYSWVKYHYDEFLNHIAVLIDGEYVENQNSGLLLRGSANQKIYILKEKYQKKYADYLAHAVSEIQNFNTSNGIISVGIHRKEYTQELNNKLRRKGLFEI